MKKEEIVEGNKIIAKFMGAVDETGTFQASTIGKTQVPTGRLWMADRFPSNMHLCSESDLQYHTSWDWLMPVVEKINKLNLSNIEHKYPRDYVRVQINVGGYCEISAGGWYDYEGSWENQICSFNSYLPELGINGQPPLIERLWSVTVQFIQWYNSKTP